jgi:hypothetical protein
MANTPLKTVVNFSDFQQEKITSVEVSLGNDRTLVATVGKGLQDNNGVNLTLKENVGGQEVATGFISKSRFKTMIKVLNTVFQQIPNDEVNG